MPAKKKAAKKKAPSQKRPVGRPRLDIDEDQVYKLAKVGCTNTEIASIVECSEDTIERNFAGIVKKGREEMKASLRRMQIMGAQEGNATMLVWLGKQYLGQSDKQEVTGADGGPVDVNLIWNQVLTKYNASDRANRVLSRN